MKTPSIPARIRINLLLFGLILGWADVTRSEDTHFVPLFNGKTLEGWNAIPGGKWSVKYGVIVGTSPSSEKRHGILLTDRKVKDFVLRLKFRVLKGNSGLYFRVDRVQSDAGVHGFQVEVDKTQDTGGLYETGGREWVVRPNAKVIDARNYKPGKWSKLELSAQGRNIVVRINGVKSIELTNDPGRLEGHIGLQLHGGQEMHVEYKDILLVRLPN